MPKITVNVPDELFEVLSEIASSLKESPENCLMLALNHLMQTDTLDNAIEGVSRMDDGQALVDFPALKEELDIDIQFHHQAMEELEALEEEDQIEVLGQFVERISEEEAELLPELDLAIKETPDGQVILSSFDFGEIVYQSGESTIIYHLAMEELEDEDDDEEDEEEDFEDEEDSEDELIFDEAEADEEYK
jgi:hypothetical protein